MLNQSGIYQIRNTVNGKIYVGSSKLLGLRWKQHRTALRAGTHRSKNLQRVWNIYSESAFVFEPLITCAKSTLIWYEQQFIDQLQPEYNNRKLANSNKGHKHTPGARARISAASKRYWEDPATRERMRVANTGSKRTDETRKLLSENKKRFYIANPEQRELSRTRSLARTDITRYELDGVTRTIQEWADHYGIGQDTIRQRIKAGWELRAILTKPTQKALITYNGESKLLVEWAREYGLKEATLAQRIKKWDMRKALTTPVRDWSNR